MSGIWKIYHDLEELYEASTNVNEIIEYYAVIVLSVSYVPASDNAHSFLQDLSS